jgi:hypothetical protein
VVQIKGNVAYVTSATADYPLGGDILDRPLSSRNLLLTPSLIKNFDGGVKTAKPTFSQQSTVELQWIAFEHFQQPDWNLCHKIGFVNTLQINLLTSFSSISSQWIN